MIRLQRARRRGIDAADSGALSDLAFLLIIFFIVIAVFNINSGFLLGIPAQDSQRLVETADLARVTITADGGYRLDDIVVTEEELTTSVTGQRLGRPNMTLMVRVHPEAPYGAVVRTIQLVREADVDNFSFGLLEEEQ